MVTWSCSKIGQDFSSTGVSKSAFCEDKICLEIGKNFSFSLELTSPKMIYLMRSNSRFSDFTSTASRTGEGGAGMGDGGGVISSFFSIMSSLNSESERSLKISNSVGDVIQLSLKLLAKSLIGSNPILLFKLSSMLMESKNVGSQSIRNIWSSWIRSLMLV